MELTKKNVRKWMRSNAEEYGTSTELAEAAAEEFDANHIGGPLDDDTHWIWELALDAKDEVD